MVKDPLPLPFFSIQETPMVQEPPDFRLVPQLFPSENGPVIEIPVILTG
jgi:hypothetical protein